MHRDRTTQDGPPRRWDTFSYVIAASLSSVDDNDDDYGRRPGVFLVIRNRRRNRSPAMSSLNSL
jgi:hypothetical protein